MAGVDAMRAHREEQDVFREIYQAVEAEARAEFVRLVEEKGLEPLKRVTILHQDRSTLILTHAVARHYERGEHKFLAVQTEHHGFFFYDEADLLAVDEAEDVGGRVDRVVICTQCALREVPKVRHCYATPVCYTCLPPPAPLPRVSVGDAGPEE
jgi:hypothetical protein